MTTVYARLLCCAFLLLPLAGCIEEELELQLQPNGAATLQLTTTISPSLDLLQILDGEEASTRAAAAYLSSFDGVSAWTDVEVLEVEGKTLCTATGWVPDVDKLGRHAVKGAQQTLRGWELARGEGESQARLTGMNTRFASAYDPARVLDASPEQLEGMRRAVLTSRGFLRVFNQELSSTVHVVLPQAPLAQSGWSAVEGQRLTLESSPKWARVEHQNLHDALVAVKARHAAGELAHEAALDKIKSLRAAAGVPQLSWKTGEASADFRAALKQARLDWPTSRWKLAIAEAEEALARAAKEQAEREREEAEQKKREAAMPDDAFEPNNSLRRATKIAPGVHRKLVLKDADWYAIAIPAQQEMRITLRSTDGLSSPTFYTSKQDALDLDFVDAEDGSQSARCAVRRKTTLYLELDKFDEAETYSLELELAPFVPADAHEPNDLVNQGRMLEAGTHEALVLSGGNDFYAIDCPETHSVSATVTSEDGVSLPVELQTWNGAGYEETASGSSPGAVRCRAVKGRVVVRVCGSPETEGTPYTLALETREGPAPDAFEPNNEDRKQRPPLAAGTYEDLWADPVDHYRVDVPGGKTLRLTATAQDEGAQLELSLRLRGEYVSLLDAAGRAPQADFTAPPQGAVIKFEISAQQLRRYTLSVELSDGEAHDAFEPNETRESAKPIELGQHSNLELIGEDWYSLQLEAGEVLKTQLDNSGVLAAVYDDRGNELISGSLEVSAPRAGTYYVCVRSGYKPKSLRYSLTLSSYPGVVAALDDLGMAQYRFRKEHPSPGGEHLYAGDLQALAAAKLIQGGLAKGVLYGYRIQVCASESEPEKEWMAVASPIDPASTKPHYVIDRYGAVFQGPQAFALDPRRCQVPEGATPAPR